MKKETMNVEKVKMTKEEKKKLAINIVSYVVVLAGLIISYVFYDKIFGEQSVFNKNIVDFEIVNKVYQMIPTVIKTFQIIVIFYVLFQIVKFLIKKLLSKSNRGITIVKLLESFLRWIIVIAALLMVLAAWGVDTTTLLASAGILTLVIGLGAQSLVADIVAGVFIVFEGEYKVGDIVVIDGWRGTVKEIGIRTTKVVDAGGNIKIINNSTITNIINQTQDLSVAKCTMSIDYDESIPRVELILRDNLDNIKKQIPAIIEGPFYKGVSELAASSVNLLFMAKCKEEDIYQVQRDLNRELFILFNKEGISIPFNQVVISNREVSDYKTTKKMTNDAKSFNDVQKNLSKDIEEKVE